MTRFAHVVASAVLALWISGCGSPDLLEVPRGPLQVGGVAVAAVAPIPYRQASYTQKIDARGGTLDFGVGSIYFPPGAIESAESITATVDGRSIAVSLSPNGLTFPVSAQPTLRFQSAAKKASGKILYVNDRNTVLDVLPTFASGDGAIQAQVKHFSKYIFGVE